MAYEYLRHYLFGLSLVDFLSFVRHLFPALIKNGTLYIKYFGNQNDDENLILKR